MEYALIATDSFDYIDMSSYGVRKEKEIFVGFLPRT